MKFKTVLHLVSFLVMMLSGFMILTGGVSWLMHDPAPIWKGMLWSGSDTLIIGAILWLFTRAGTELSRREGIGIVVFGWLIAVFIGAIPFLRCGAVTNPVDAIFESCSGLTTTGASIISDIDGQSRGILFWRAVLHLLGGMGILVLVVAIIPYLGVGGMQIFSAEVTGPSKDRLTPRIASTAKLLWGVYLLLNLILTLLLLAGGMSLFDAVCHAFATISTGGFSTHSASIAAFDSRYIENVITIFMLLSGMNFALHYKALRGQPLSYFRDPECRFYIGMWAVAVVIIAGNLISHGDYSAAHALQHAAFYTTSILTCTGFGTVDYDTWPVLSKTMLMLLFLVGGCAGSTSGGIKQMRVVILIKKLGREIRTFLKPSAIYPVKLGRQIISQDIVYTIGIFFFTYLAAVAAGTLIMSWYTVDQSTAFSSVISCLAGAGPGFSTIGPVLNYAHLADGAKLTLTALMLLGRLEFYTILVLFLPTFWRK